MKFHPVSAYRRYTLRQPTYKTEGYIANDLIYFNVCKNAIRTTVADSNGEEETFSCFKGFGFRHLPQYNHGFRGSCYPSNLTPPPPKLKAGGGGGGYKGKWEGIGLALQHFKVGTGLILYYQAHSIPFSSVGRKGKNQWVFVKHYSVPPAATKSKKLFLASRSKSRSQGH